MSVYQPIVEHLKVDIRMNLKTSKVSVMKSRTLSDSTVHAFSAVTLSPIGAQSAQGMRLHSVRRFKLDVEIDLPLVFLVAND